jgi:hypothetical protein
MKDLNMKSFYRLKVPVNKKNAVLTIYKKNIKGNKKLPSMSLFIYPSEAFGVEKALIINYDSMINSDITTVCLIISQSKY